MVAQFKEKANATSLEVILSEVASGGGESVVEKVVIVAAAAAIAIAAMAAIATAVDIKVASIQL